MLEVGEARRGHGGVLDLGRQVAGTPLLPVLEEVNQGLGPQGERPESHSGRCSGTVWPVLEGHPPSGPRPSGALDWVLSDAKLSYQLLP